MLLLLVSEWGCMCDICVIQKMENTSSYRLLKPLYTEILLELPLVVETGIDAIALDYTDCNRFVLIRYPEKSNKQTPTSCSLSISLLADLLLLRDLHRRRRLRVKWHFKDPRFDGGQKTNCVQLNRRRRHWLFAPVSDLFSIFSNRDPWIVVERTLILAIILGVYQLHYKTHKARNGHMREGGGGGIGFKKKILSFIFSSHSQFLYLALPLLHLAIQPTKNWPRVGGQMS